MRLHKSLSHLEIGDTVFFRCFEQYRYVLREFQTHNIVFDAFIIPHDSYTIKKQSMPIRAVWPNDDIYKFIVHEKTIKASSSEYIL
jgi:hypothetical protein